jgi:iron complex outermembrane receptor protein
MVGPTTDDNDETAAFRVHRCELLLNAVNVAPPALANSFGSDRFYTGPRESSTMLRSRALVAVAFALLASGRIFAAARVDEQTLPAPDRSVEDDELVEIVVTGSRIARPDDERLEPTTVIRSDFMNMRGYGNVIDALNELPAFGQPGNSLVGNQTTMGVGQSFANLFSLGSQRTLTLVNGMRFVPANSPSVFGATGSGGEQVDLNVIPTQLIDRIETIAVGGAPVYGADAIAGTVNIILKRDYEGFDVDAQGGLSGRDDAGRWRLRALAGKNFLDARGNVTMSVEYAHSDGLLAMQRQAYANGIAYMAPPTPEPYAYALYSNQRVGSISTSGVPMLADGYLNFNPNFAIKDGAGQPLAFTGNGQLAPYSLGRTDGSGVYNIGGEGLNLDELNTLLSPQRRLNVTTLGDFTFNERIRLFGELWYSDTYTNYPISQGAYDTALFAPAGSVSGNLILNVHNPFLAPQAQAILAQNVAAFAAIPGNPTQTTQFYLARLNEDLQSGGASAEQITRRAVLGLDGALPLFAHEIHYQIAASYGRTSNESVSPSINFQNFENALNAVSIPGGHIICAPGYKNSPVPTQSSTCAPLDPFGSGVSSAAAVAYVTGLAQATSTLTQRDLTASLNGELLRLPAGAIKAALGYENRRESADFEPDQFYQDGAGYEIPIEPLSGSFTTNEVYGELLVPVISPEQYVPLIHRVEIEAAAREVDHSVAGKATTWTAGLRFEPVSRLQFRGNYTRAIRSPSVTEAFLPTSEAFTTASDPCDKSLIGSGPNPAVRAANCARAGIVQPFASNILSFSEPISVSGDPQLQNEIADSRTVGFVFRATDHMHLAVDYVKINISQAIGQLNATNVLDACYDSPVYPNAYCSKISRASGGQIQLVKTGYANAGFENFNGVTTELEYAFDLPFGRVPGEFGTVDLRLNEFFENQLAQAVGSADVSVLAGSIGNSKHRAVLDIGWSKGHWSALGQTVFVGRAVWDNALSATNTQQQGVGSWWVENLTLGYEASSHVRLRFVVNNLLDKPAPFPLPAAPPNSTLLIPNGIETYFSGILGRYFLASVELKL